MKILKTIGEMVAIAFRIDAYKLGYSVGQKKALNSMQRYLDRQWKQIKKND